MCQADVWCVLIASAHSKHQLYVVSPFHFHHWAEVTFFSCSTSKDRYVHYFGLDSTSFVVGLCCKVIFKKLGRCLNVDFPL